MMKAEQPAAPRRSWIRACRQAARDGSSRRSGIRLGGFLALAALLASGAAACGSGSGSATAGGSACPAPPGETGVARSSLTVGSGPIDVDIVTSFSGANANYGVHALPGAEAGAAEANRLGGILGHRVVITQTDTRGDPADAVPAVNQMLATTRNLAFVLGPASNTAPAVLPIFERSGVPTYDDAPTVQLDNLHNRWIWRVEAPDSQGGVAMAYQAAIVHHWTRAALVFGADAGSQSLVGPVTQAYAKMGGHIVANETLTPDQTSYRSEIAKLLAAHPQVIFTETDDATAATFWSEMKSMHGLNIPTIGSGTTAGPDYYQAVTPAIGSTTALGTFLESTAYSTLYTKATSYFVQDLHLWKPGALPLLSHINFWDTLNLVFLAMEKAHSVQPQKWINCVYAVSQPGGVKVYNLQQGIAQLRAGHTIQYIGTKGSMQFDLADNSIASNYQATSFGPNANAFKILNQIPLTGIVKYQR